MGVIDARGLVYDDLVGGRVKYDMALVEHNPQFFLPNNIYLIAGESYTIWSDCIGNWCIGDNLDYTYTCNIGTDVPRGYQINPEFKDIGSHLFTVEYEGYSDSTTINVIPDNNSLRSDVSINFVGDSLTAQGAVYRSTTVESPSGFTFTQYGTQGIAPDEHEGISGWTWGQFLGATSPYYDGAEINITDYRTTKVSATNPFVIVPIQLGINDLIANDKDFNYIDTTILNRVAAFTTDFTNDSTVRVILCLTPKGENSGEGWKIDYGTSRNQNFFISKIQYYWQKLIENYEESAGGSDVIISPQGYFIDRDNGYPKTGDIHSNAVHPNSTGYTQLGKALRGTIEGEFFNEGTELLTNNYFENWQGNLEPNDHPTGWILTGNSAGNFFEQDLDGNLRLSCTTSTSTRISQNILIPATEYKLTVVCSEYVSGSIRIQEGGTNILTILSTGTHVATFTATATDLRIRSNAVDCHVNLSFISIKETI